jgi:hypothetical protein
MQGTALYSSQGRGPSLCFPIVLALSGHEPDRACIVGTRTGSRSVRRGTNRIALMSRAVTICHGLSRYERGCHDMSQGEYPTCHRVIRGTLGNTAQRNRSIRHE